MGSGVPSRGSIRVPLRGSFLDFEVNQGEKSIDLFFPYGSFKEQVPKKKYSSMVLQTQDSVTDLSGSSAWPLQPQQACLVQPRQSAKLQQARNQVLEFWKPASLGKS